MTDEERQGIVLPPWAVSLVFSGVIAVIPAIVSYATIRQQVTELARDVAQLRAESTRTNDLLAKHVTDPAAHAELRAQLSSLPEVLTLLRETKTKLDRVDSRLVALETNQDGQRRRIDDFWGRDWPRIEQRLDRLEEDAKP